MCTANKFFITNTEGIASESENEVAIREIHAQLTRMFRRKRDKDVKKSTKITNKGVCRKAHPLEIWF